MWRELLDDDIHRLVHLRGEQDGLAARDGVEDDLRDGEGFAGSRRADHQRERAALGLAQHARLRGGQLGAREDGRLGAFSGRDAGADVPGLARAMSSKIAASGVDISPRPAITCSSVRTPRASVGRRHQRHRGGAEQLYRAVVLDQVAQRVLGLQRRERLQVVGAQIGNQLGDDGGELADDVHVEGGGWDLAQDRFGVGLRLLLAIGINQRGEQRKVDMLLLQVDAEKRARAFLLDARGPEEQWRAVEIALLAPDVGAAPDEEDRAVDQEFFSAVHVGGVLRRDAQAQRDLHAVASAGDERFVAIGEDKVFGLVLVEHIVEHATARVGGEAVVVVAADAGEERRDRPGGNARRPGESLQAGERLRPFSDGSESAALWPWNVSCHDLRVARSVRSVTGAVGRAPTPENRHARFLLPALSFAQAQASSE